MNRFRRPDTPTPNRAPPLRPNPLSDQRYQELLEQAQAFFASAEVPPEAARLAAISEINEQMERYGLTVDDLV